jgi:acyl-CoA reductase-like NAD-dependent aldehyde dehydrogenase
MRPTVVVTDIDDNAPLMAEEQFCPAIPVATYETSVDEAIERTNASDFGLSGSVWGRDYQRAVAIARNIEAGQVWGNTHGFSPSII